MNGEAVRSPVRHRAWSGIGAVCLLLCVVCSAAVPAFAQQASASACPPALSNSSFASWSGPDRSTPAPARGTPEIRPYAPMTRQERWQDYERQNFDSYGAFFQAFFTGLGDDQGNVPNWDSGAAGLAEHVGSEFARFTVGGTIHSSLAAALHQDTRYFPCSCRGVFPRTLHAVGRTLLTYGDNGHIYPDVSGLAGIYGGAMLMTEWYPAKYTATGYGVRQANLAAGITSAICVIREFSPEIKRAFHRHKAGAAVAEH